MRTLPSNPTPKEATKVAEAAQAYVAEAAEALQEAKEAAKVAERIARDVVREQRQEERQEAPARQRVTAIHPKARYREGAPRAYRTVALPAPPIRKVTKDSVREALTNDPKGMSQAHRLFPVSPCGETYRDFRTGTPALERQEAWAEELERCVGLRGLGRLAPKDARKLKSQLVGRNVKATPPVIDDVDPWAFEVDPCDGMSYKRFRGGFSRKDAYWAAKRGEHGPSKKKVDSSAAKLKRLAWQEKLHDCAVRVWQNRARVSKKPNVRKAAERFAPQVDYSAEDFMDLDGLGKVAKKKAPAKKAKTSRCYKAPKRLDKKTCGEETFRKNLRHLFCVGGKKDKQAKAIAISVLKKSCGVPKTKVRGVKAIVQAGKRKKARAARRK